jgi:hypothetical protein
MQREIRLARERENEFRRSKGLPELPPVENEEEDSGVGEREMNGDHHHPSPSSYFRHSPLSPAPDTVRNFASNRLQREILQQKEREIRLRQEGHIITTSEEHIQPGRYAQVVGESEGADGTTTPRRNFRTPAQQRQQKHTPASTPDISTPSSPSTDSTPQTPRDAAGIKKVAASFKYREFAQTAESKIERELREMREREEELR